MKVTHVVAWHGIIGLVVDIEILIMFSVGFIDQLDDSAFPERHGRVAVQGAAVVEDVVGMGIGRSAEEKGLVTVDKTMAEPEEVAERDQYRGRRCVIERNLHKAFSVVLALRHPDMGDATWPLDIGQYAGFSGGDAPPVVISPAAIPG